MMATTRIINGVERVALTTAPSTRLAAGAPKISPRPLIARNTPSGRPNAVAIKAETPTMYRVCPSASAS
jgi:hypothetical protein